LRDPDRPEKIWDAVKGRTLPIYYGRSNRIFETFTQNSFIDVSEFRNLESIFDYVQNMDERNIK